MKNIILGISAYYHDSVASLIIDEEIGAVFTTFSEEDLIKRIVSCLISDKVVGIARDRLEFGPRSLGHRSILANSQNIEMEKI